MIKSLNRFSLALALALASWLRPLAGQAATPESLVTQLGSPDWIVRSDGLARLSRLPQGSLPASYRDAIVQLLEREAISPDTSAFGEGKGEGYGEYMIQVVDAALALEDPRTLRGMALWGTQVSSRAKEFVAEQGSAALPYLDEAWNSPYGNRHDVVMTWAIMLATYKSRMTDAEHLTVLRSVLRADSLAVVNAASRAPLPEALPLIEGIATSPTRRSILRAAATQSAAELRPLRAALQPTEFMQRLSDVLRALCLGSQGARSTACASLSASLSRASVANTNNQPSPARDTLTAFAAQVDAGFQQGVWSDGEHRLLAANARYLGFRLGSAIFLHGSGGTANPPTLALSTLAPAGTTTKYQDSPALAFANGNPWLAVGTWTSPRGLGSGTLSALGAAQVWLGLKNSDDIGTNFDLRVEAYKNGTLVTAGQTLCVQGVTRNADLAKAVTVAFSPFTATTFDGVANVLSFKVLTRIGTTAAGATCGGHSNAVGLRLYFDAVSRAAQFAATF